MLLLLLSNNSGNNNNKIHDMVVQILKVLLIITIIVSLLLVVVLLLSLLPYQNMYSEAAVESCYVKNPIDIVRKLNVHKALCTFNLRPVSREKVLFESEWSHWVIPARVELPAILGGTIFQSTSQNRPTTISIIIIIIIIIVIIIFIINTFLIIITSIYIFYGYRSVIVGL